MAGLDPAIHALLCNGVSLHRRGCPEQVRAWPVRKRDRFL